MRWLITGGCGFLGTALIRKLLNIGENEIRVLDNLSIGTREDLARVSTFVEKDLSNLSEFFSGVELIVGDILDEGLIKKITKGCDIIVHFAANTGVGPSVKDPKFDMVSNVVGTFNCLEAARINQVNRFIFASSGAPAGEVSPPIHEELPPHPVSPYGASKLAGEGYCSAYFKTFGINTVCLRFGNVYGPGSMHKSSIIAKFIKQALLGERLEIYGDGTQTRDFIFVDDLIDAVYKSSVTDRIGGETFQIATNIETTIDQIAQLVKGKLADHGFKNITLINSEYRVGDVQRNFSNISKAKAILDWAPVYNLDYGLEKTIRYFLE